MNRSVVIVGASADPAKYGHKAIRAHRAQGFDVYPVNPKGGEIEGLTVYPAVADVPLEKLDRVSVYVPPAVALGVLDEIAAKGCEELFLNPGSDSREVIERAGDLGLAPIVACSISNLGFNPAAM